jgi:hypothetical protein
MGKEKTMGVLLRPWDLGAMLAPENKQPPSPAPVTPLLTDGFLSPRSIPARYNRKVTDTRIALASKSYNPRRAVEYDNHHTDPEGYSCNHCNDLDDYSEAIEHTA